MKNISIVMFCLISFTEMAFGGVYNGPHYVPGIIQAEDFDSGALEEVYYAQTPGNQGNSTYRTGTDADIFNDGVRIYVSSSDSVYKTRPEWFNYTFEVIQAGWYEVIYRVKPEATSRMITTIDDRPVGCTGWLFAIGGFNDITVVKRVRLTVGIHVIKTMFHLNGTKIGLDYIKFNRIDDLSSPWPKYELVETSESMVVASAVVTRPPYNADNTGQADATTAIQTALDDAAAWGGGVVYVPPGIYRITDNLIVGGQVTLSGFWVSPLEGGSGSGTILMVDQPPVADDLTACNADGFIMLAADKSEDSDACVRDISIWYPHQQAGNIQPYP